MLLENFKSPDEIQAANPRLFPSPTSMQWYLRQNREQLLAAKALLKVNGRIVIDELAFETVVTEIGLAAAKAA